MSTKADRLMINIVSTVFGLALAIPAMSQETGKALDQNTTKIAASQTQSTTASPVRYTAGQTAMVEGTIVKRGPDGFTMRDFHGSVVEVSLTGSTVVKERKSNPFRGARNYGVTELLRGLQVEVKGHGSSSGALEANEIRFTQDDLRLASTMEARVQPVEDRLNGDETRLGQTEENAQRLSGQVSELSAVSNAARGGAKAAQETADSALDSAKQANDTAMNAKAGVRVTNERITALDDFDAKTSLIVNFKVGSSVLSRESKDELDKLAEETKNDRGFVIEVAGFASADGSPALNRILSQHRADAVIRYLAENHDIPLRRFITPFGYGDKMPVADNKTRDGRMQNRRVEVRILVSKGLAQVSPPSIATAH